MLNIFRRFFTQGAIISTFGAVFSTMVSYEEKYLYNIQSEEINQNSLVFVGIFISALTVVNGIRMYGTNLLKNKLYIYLIDNFFNKICLQKIETWDSNYDKNELTKCINTDIKNYSDSVIKIFSIFQKNLLTIFLTGYFLYKESVAYLLIGISLCICRSVFLENLAKHWETKYEELNETKRTIENIITEYINNSTNMQLCGLNTVYKNILKDEMTIFNVKQTSETTSLSIFMSCFFILTKFIDACLYFVIMYWSKLSIIKTFILISYFKLITEAFQSVTDIPKTLAYNKTSYETIKKYFKKEFLTDVFNYRTQIVSRPDIIFKDITFKYPCRDDYIFKNLNLNIKYGEKIALVGKSGGGKSTLIKLMCGLYVPNKGHITIDDKDVTLLDIKDYITVAPQQSILFENKTLRENLNLFKDKSEDELKYVLNLVKLEDLEYLLDEKIVNLSGGQAQRLGLARVLLSDNPIIILDEPFSALDVSLKTIVKKNVLSYLAFKTVILITHEEPLLDFKIINIEKFSL